MSQLQCECAHKDDLIQQLREEVTNLQNFVRHVELQRCPSCQQLPSVCRPAAAAAGVTSSQQVTSTHTCQICCYLIKIRKPSHEVTPTIWQKNITNNQKYVTL